jgi:hypothetical protein
MKIWTKERARVKKSWATADKPQCHFVTPSAKMSLQDEEEFCVMISTIVSSMLLPSPLHVSLVDKKGKRER